MLAMFVAALSTAQPAVEIQAGRADWGSFPAVRQVARDHPTPAMVGRVAKMLRGPGCVLPGQSAKRFDITVPYLVRLQPDRSAERVVVADLGCPELEAYVGSIVLQLSEAGDFHPEQSAEPRWYAGRMNFNLN